MFPSFLQTPTAILGYQTEQSSHHRVQLVEPSLFERCNVDLHILDNQPDHGQVFL